MIISSTIKAIYQIRLTGKRVDIREIKYNVYNFTKAEEFGNINNGKDNTFQTSCTNISIYEELGSEVKKMYLILVFLIVCCSPFCNIRLLFIYIQK